nr:MAG TPA: hypothetical protein [Caudoviricetes sp.]DAR45773.1 MAG TPA: hypothetical protein [Bacteriophage sp.]DAV84183.1 MAG TPA: hypothetical protein [Caudoviricetes sp.]
MHICTLLICILFTEIRYKNCFLSKIYIVFK